MTEALRTALDAAPARLAHAGWQAAVLALLVMLVSWTLGGRLEPRWRFALWLLVVLRLALPVAPAAPWSLFRLVPAPARPSGSEEVPPAVPMAARTDHTVAGPVAAPVPVADEVPAPHVAPDETEATPTPAATPEVPARGPALVWLAGVLLLLARQGGLHLRLHRRRRTWRAAADPALLELFRRCREELGVIRPVRLWVVPDGTGPATCGLWRPCILLPDQLPARLTRDELRLVLLHELTHVRRYDAWTDHVATLVTAVHWFNPVAWLARACLRREREPACDAAVLRHLGGEGAARYGHALLKIAEHLSVPAPLPGAVGVLGKDRSLTRRIHMIARYQKPTAAAQALGALLVLLLGALGLTDGAAEPARQPDAKRAVSKRPDGTSVALVGVCRDEKGEPVAGARVVLYREDHRHQTPERLRSTVTGADGRFRFDVPPAPPAEPDRPTWGYAVAITKAGRGSILQPLYGNLAKELPFTLGPAAMLRGRVTGPDGKPVAGARVWGRWLGYGPVEGVCTARTDADGRYAITDMTAWGPEVKQPKKHGDVYSSIVGCYFDVLHPDYAHVRPMYRDMPATVDVVLQPAGVIEGKVIDQVTGKPAAGVAVSMQETHASPGGGWHEARTDAAGRYRFPSLLAGKYNVWADAPDRACAAIDSFAVEAGKTLTAPDLHLVEGGWLEGRVIEAGTGKPVGGAVKGGRLEVGLYGPSRPKSGACCQACPVDDRGRFRLHVAPGRNFPYLMNGDYWQRTQRREFYEKGIDVRAGEVVHVVFRVLPTKPIPDPEPAPVRMAVPVPAERRAAERVRQLGGWYVTDAAGHVIEVNMVYHETKEGVRFSNDRTDTDEALRAVPAFPRLKRLLLTKGQATDDGLRGLAGLHGLESLYVWDADGITDAGVAHLTGLTKLRDIHLSPATRLRDGSSAGLGDESLAVFGRLPNLRQLSLQGNAFSDDGLKHLAGLRHLRSLWIGMNRDPITDAGARHLAGLTSLQALDLQGSKLTDAGVASLAGLKQLRTLFLNSAPGGAITDASVGPLLGMTRLETLGIQNTGLTEAGVRRLVTLPKLKELTLSSSAISNRLRDELRRKRPGLQLYVSGPPRND